MGPTGPCPATALAGSGATATPNFTGAILTPDAAGSLTIGGTTVDAGNGFALGNISSPATITPSGAEDLVAFTGGADFFCPQLKQRYQCHPLQHLDGL